MQLIPQPNVRSYWQQISNFHTYIVNKRSIDFRSIVPTCDWPGENYDIPTARRESLHYHQSIFISKRLKKMLIPIFPADYIPSDHESVSHHLQSLTNSRRFQRDSGYDWFTSKILGDFIECTIVLCVQSSRKNVVAKLPNFKKHHWIAGSVLMDMKNKFYV